MDGSASLRLTWALVLPPRGGGTKATDAASSDDYLEVPFVFFSNPRVLPLTTLRPLWSRITTVVSLVNPPRRMTSWLQRSCQAPWAYSRQYIPIGSLHIEDRQFSPYGDPSTHFGLEWVFRFLRSCRALRGPPRAWTLISRHPKGLGSCNPPRSHNLRGSTVHFRFAKGTSPAIFIPALSWLLRFLLLSWVIWSSDLDWSCRRLRSVYNFAL